MKKMMNLTRGGVLLLVGFNFIFSAPVHDNDAVYVSASGDAGNAGTLSSPLSSISSALALAASKRITEVRVQAGEYYESGISLISGIHLLGGFDESFITRSVEEGVLNTTISGPSVGAQDCSDRIITAQGITEGTVLEGFIIANGQSCAPGGGLLIENSGPGLVIVHNIFKGSRSIYYGGKGGNIAIINSAPEITGNLVSGGFAPMYGQDLYIAGQFDGGLSATFTQNTFGSAFSIYNESPADLSTGGNSFLDWAQAVYVSPEGDDANTGGLFAPVKSIKKGLGIAREIGAGEVRVARGTYLEAAINLANGISLKGGYFEDFRSRSLDTSRLSVVIAPETDPRLDGLRIFLASQITEKTILEGFSVSGGKIHGAGGGILIENCGSGFEIRHNVFDGNTATYFSAMGGNMAIINSAVWVHDNFIINGYASVSKSNGWDLYMIGDYAGDAGPVIEENTFTHPSYISDNIGIEFSSNMFLSREGEEQLSISRSASLPGVPAGMAGVYNLLGRRVASRPAEDGTVLNAISEKGRRTRGFFFISEK